jgi:hypothetical protein
VASKPNQSPKEEKTIEFQSFLNAGIAKTLLLSGPAVAAGYGSGFGMG